MSVRKQVSCINKRGSHYNPHERIQAIGGIQAGSRWKRDENVAIANIKLGIEDYYVVVSGREVNVIIARHEGRDYLKTTADGYAPNNLLNLSECPSY